LEQVVSCRNSDKRKETIHRTLFYVNNFRDTSAITSAEKSIKIIQN